MDFLPKELEDIIIDYKKHLEYQDLIREHRKSFNGCLTFIKDIRNNSYKTHMSRTERMVTIGAFIHKRLGFTYCHCFRVCLICNNIKSSSRMCDNNIGNRCKCQ